MIQTSLLHFHCYLSPCPRPAVPVNSIFSRYPATANILTAPIAL